MLESAQNWALVCYSDCRFSHSELEMTSGYSFLVSSERSSERQRESARPEIAFFKAKLGHTLEHWLPPPLIDLISRYCSAEPSQPLVMLSLYSVGLVTDTVEPIGYLPCMQVWPCESPSGKLTLFRPDEESMTPRNAPLDSYASNLLGRGFLVLSPTMRHLV